MKKKINYICLSVFLLLSVSCKNDTKSQDGSEIFGIYTFQYPSNELEELIIKEDSTYTKNIYSSKESFLEKKSPIYTNIGEWSTNPRNEKLDFKDWLSYCEMGDPNIVLSQPQNTYMTGISWVPPSITHDGLIIIYDETNYIFKRIRGK